MLKRNLRPVFYPHLLVSEWVTQKVSRREAPRCLCAPLAGLGTQGSSSSRDSQKACLQCLLPRWAGGGTCPKLELVRVLCLLYSNTPAILYCSQRDLVKILLSESFSHFPNPEALCGLAPAHITPAHSDFFSCLWNPQVASHPSPKPIQFPLVGTLHLQASNPAIHLPFLQIPAQRSLSDKMVLSPLA